MTESEHQIGMTLPEVLIAISLIATLALMLGGSTRGLLQASQRISSATAEQENRRNDKLVFENILAGIIITDPLDKMEGFSGRRNSLTFLALNTTGAPVHVELHSEPDSGAVLSVNAATDYENSPYKLVLFPDYDQLTLSYYGAIEGELPEWSQTWEHPTMPRLVRLQAKAPSGLEETLLETTIAAQAPLTCRFDPVSRLCRSDG